jgi:hypothetical protein
MAAIGLGPQESQVETDYADNIGFQLFKRKANLFKTNYIPG